MLGALSFLLSLGQPSLTPAAKEHLFSDYCLPRRQKGSFFAWYKALLNSLINPLGDEVAVVTPDATRTALEKLSQSSCCFAKVLPEPGGAGSSCGFQTCGCPVFLP